jgi:DNA-binding protein WhiA
LEFVCSRENKAKQLQQVIHAFEIEAKMIRRKKYFVVYLKESEAIVDLLNIHL